MSLRSVTEAGRLEKPVKGTRGRQSFGVYLAGVDTADRLGSLPERRCFSIEAWKTFCLGTAFSLCMVSTPLPASCLVWG